MENLREIIFTTICGLESIIAKEDVTVIDGLATNEKQVIDEYHNGKKTDKAFMLMVPLYVGEETDTSIAVVLNENKSNIIGLNEFLSDYTHFLKEYSDQKDKIKVSFYLIERISNEIFDNFLSIYLPWMKDNFEIVEE